MTAQFVNIHTHRPTGRGIELRTAGVHPWQAGSVSTASLLPLPAEVQAIGETGLDFVRGPERQTQLAAFREQLALARERRLPVVLHCVRAFEAVMRELAACPPRAAIFHGFIGSPEQARQALGRGYYLSFGERTFSSPKTLAALRITLLAQLFLETDESDTPIEEIYALAAVARGVGVEELKAATTANYERLFSGAARDASDTGAEDGPATEDVSGAADDPGTVDASAAARNRNENEQDNAKR